eukprot:4158008-Karenia_brevis.AAC.1
MISGDSTNTISIFTGRNRVKAARLLQWSPVELDLLQCVSSRYIFHHFLRRFKMASDTNATLAVRLVVLGLRDAGLQ